MRWAATAVAGAMLLQAPVVRRPPSPQAPQTNASEDVPTIRVQSRLVTVAVNVVDSKGVPVAGLTQSDFEVLEDGKSQKIAFFERESSTPLSIVLAIDASESVLRDEHLEKEAAKRFVKTLLRSQDELDLMDFADSVREIVSFTNQPKRIEGGLGELQRGEETALYDAIYLGAQRLQGTRTDAGRRRVMVLITDGGNTKKGTRYEQALEQAQRAGAMLYSIIIVPVYADAGRNTGGEHALIQMAEDTGGKYYYVADPKDLIPAFEKVSDDLRTQYVIGYYAPQHGADTSLRRIAVHLKDPAVSGKSSLRYRTGYYADAR